MEAATSSSQALTRVEENLARLDTASQSSLNGTENETAPTVSYPAQLFSIATPLGDALLVTMDRSRLDRSMQSLVTVIDEEPVSTVHIEEAKVDEKLGTVVSESYAL